MYWYSDIESIYHWVIIREALVSNTLMDDVRVRSFIFSTGQTDYSKPVSLVIDVTIVKDGCYIRHREKVVARFSYTICSFSIFFTYMVVQGMVTGKS